MYKVTYINGMSQILELITQAEFNEYKSANEKNLTDRQKHIKNGLKKGTIFTDESPIYMSQFRNGDIVLSHGTYKCILEHLE